MINKKSMIAPCKAGQHNLVEIYRAGEPGDQDIVKWCTICGAVVIDHEGEGAVEPGGTLKMMGPKSITFL